MAKYEMLDHFDNGEVKLLLYKYCKYYIVEEQKKPMLTDLLVGAFSGRREVYHCSSKKTARAKFDELKNKYM